VAAVIGILAVLAGSTTVFAQLQLALNTIWDAEVPKRTAVGTLVRVRVLSFAVMVGIGFLLLVSLVISALISAASASLSGVVAIPPVALQLVETTASVCIVAALFAMVYKVLPDVKIAWGDVWVGAFVTSVLFNLGKLLTGAYLGNSSVGSAYGAAGSLVVLLIWIYYSAQLVLLGAEFTHVYSMRHGSHREPEPAR
jgi:membrane protein